MDIGADKKGTMPEEDVGSRECVFSDARCERLERGQHPSVEVCSRCPSWEVSLEAEAGLGRLVDFMKKQEARIRDLERGNRGMALLLEILNFVQGAEDLETTLRIILACVTSGYSIGFNRAFLFLLGEDGKSLRGSLAVGPRTPQEAHEIWKDIEEKANSLEDIVSASSMGGRAGDVELTKLVRGMEINVGDGVCVLEECISRGGTRVIGDPGSLGENDVLRKLNSRTFVCTPITTSGRPIGIIVADNMITGEVPSDEQVGLLKALAYQVGQIIASATHHEDILRRLRELSTLTEVSKGILSTTDLETDLSLIARISAQVLNARGAILRLVDDETKALVTKAMFGITLGEMRGPAEEGARWIAEEVAKEGRPKLIKDAAMYAESDPDLARRKNLICVPLAKADRVIGTLTVFDRATADSLGGTGFSENDLRFLTVLAGQAAVAIDNAKLIDGLRKSQQRIRELHRHLVRSERLAALGELSSQVAHEIRNPLTAIGGFARSIQRSLSEDDPNRKHVDIIVKETDRLERILTEQLCFAKLSPPDLKPRDINGVIKEVLDLFREKLKAKKAAFKIEMEESLPRVMIDPDKIKQVFINILQNAIDNIRENGSIWVSSCRQDRVLEIRIGNDGPPIEGAMLNRLFVPFATTKSSGSGLGLAVTYEIVYEHGGAIDVRSEEKETVFLITLPLKIEGDRRRGPIDRRSMMIDRRRDGRNP
jgi:signal transduction histidine kinase